MQINVYGPSGTDSTIFFENFFQVIEKIDNEYIAIGGDWNVALDPTKDLFRYRAIGRQRARKKIEDFMTVLKLTDVWRALNIDKRQYTWRKFNSTQQGRLDYFLISDSLLCNTNSAYISPGYRSDHSLISLELNTDKFKRHRPHWKFNNSLLYDPGYVMAVKEVILNFKKEYSALVCNRLSIDSINNSVLQFTINNQLFLEMLLLEIRGKTIAYSSHKRKEEKAKEQALNIEIGLLEQDVNEENVEELENKRQELENIREKRK